MLARLILQLVTSPRGAKYFSQVNYRIWSKSYLLACTDDFNVDAVDTSMTYLWMASVVTHLEEIRVPCLVHFTSKNSSNGRLRLHIDQNTCYILLATPVLQMQLVTLSPSILNLAMTPVYSYHCQQWA